MADIRKAIANGGVHRRLLGTGLGVVLAGLPREAGAVHQEGTFRQAGNLAVYLVVIPSAVVRGHPPEHRGQGMHGGPPPDPYAHHLIVAVFEVATGERVTDAAVTAIVHGLHHRLPEDMPRERIAMEPMSVGGAPAYGGFATLPARAQFSIEVEVVRPRAAPVRAVFQHWRRQPSLRLRAGTWSRQPFSAAAPRRPALLSGGVRQTGDACRRPG